MLLPEQNNASHINQSTSQAPHATHFSQSLRRRSPQALSSPFSFTSMLLVPVLARNCWLVGWLSVGGWEGGSVPYSG